MTTHSQTPEDGSAGAEDLHETGRNARELYPVIRDYLTALTELRQFLADARPAVETVDNHRLDAALQEVLAANLEFAQSQGPDAFPTLIAKFTEMTRAEAASTVKIDLTDAEHKLVSIIDRTLMLGAFQVCAIGG